MKRCPNCSGKLKDRVIFCAACGVNVYTGTFPKKTINVETETVILIFVTLVILLFVGIIILAANGLLYFG